MNKSTPKQTAAIKQLMTKRRRELSKADPRRFPKFIPGMSTATYIAQYARLNDLDMAQNSADPKKWANWETLRRPAPQFEADD